MKQIKGIVSLFVLLSAALGVSAQNDAKARKLLDKSAEAFKAAGAIEAYFTLNIKDAPNKVSESFDGRIQMNGEKLFIDTPEYDIYFDGKTQWVHQKRFDEVNITEPKEEEMQALNPAFVFEMYKKGSKYEYVGEKTDIKMRKVDEIELTPKDKKGDISKIKVQISRADSMPVLIHLFYKNNIENLIHINLYKTGQKLSDSSFVFDAKEHPDAEIIDLR